MIPEQVWDTDDIPERGLFLGRPSGSAMPLAWAHAEYLKLRRSLRDGRVFDTPAADGPALPGGARSSPTSRSGGSTTGGRRSPPGEVLRVEVLAPAVVRWSADGWATTREVATRDTGLGVHVADLPTDGLAGGERDPVHVPLARGRPLGRQGLRR